MCSVYRTDFVLFAAFAYTRVNGPTVTILYQTSRTENNLTMIFEMVFFLFFIVHFRPNDSLIEYYNFPA